MLRLAREHNIPAVPVHDSLIVPRSKEAIAERVLDEQFIQNYRREANAEGSSIDRSLLLVCSSRLGAINNEGAIGKTLQIGSTPCVPR